MWEIQVYVREGDRYTWRSIRPSGGRPYQWSALGDALKVLEMCYPYCTRSEVRVVQV